MEKTWLDFFTDWVNAVDDRVWGTTFEVAGFPVPILILSFSWAAFS